MQSIIEFQRALLPAAQRWIAEAPYETKGVLYSEVLFLAACLGDNAPRRFLESGRARGQSTLLLSIAFPNSEIVSVEYERNSEDAVVASRRLDGRNVKLLFGDAKKILPEMVLEGDVAVIDGPKGFKAVDLALKLLAGGKVRAVFIHDLTNDTHERRFIQKFFPEALFSDQEEFATIGEILDRDIRYAIPENRTIGSVNGYGFGLAFLPRESNRSYSLLRGLAFLRRTYDRIRREKKQK